MGQRRRRLGGASIDLQIAVSADDGYSSGAGGFSNDGTDLLAGVVGATTFDAFARFPSVDVSQGATIIEAFIQVSGQNGADGAGTRTNITMEDADDAIAPLSRVQHNADARTTAFTAWDGITFVEDVYTQSDSIVDVVQEVVDRGSWASGNAMMILWDDDSSDIGKGYDVNSVDDASGLSMLLHIGFGG